MMQHLLLLAGTIQAVYGAAGCSPMQQGDKAAWQAFQADVQTLKLKRQRFSGQLADVVNAE